MAQSRRHRSPRADGMKCMKHAGTGEVVRIKNEAVEVYLKNFYNFCSKSEYKKVK
jgi:hypothetical protein